MYGGDVMAKFIPTCRQCFQTKGQTILLKLEGGKLVCPNDPKHETNLDIQIL